MKFSRAFVLAGAVMTVSACKSDPISRVVTPEVSAAIRWVNAIPDTVGMDYRVVDYPSNASEPGLLFGASSGNWRIIPAGSHQVRAFFACPAAILNTCSQTSIVSQVLDEATFSLEANKKYTILHYGFAKAGASPQKKLILIEDVVPTVPAGQVAIRVINAAPALGSAISVYAALDTAAKGAATGSPAFATVAPGSVTSWINVPVATGLNSYKITATAPGSTAALVNFFAPVGTAAVAATPTTAPLDPVAGSRQAGSAFTIVIFGPRVAYVLQPSIGGGPVAGSTTGLAATLLDVFPPRISP